MKRNNILIPIFLLLNFSVFGQIFNLYELDQYNKDPNTKPIQDGNYADINSTLFIKFNKDSIADAIREFTGGDTISLDELRQLKVVLTNQVDILKGFKSYGEDPTLESLNDLAVQMNKFFNEAEKYPEIEDLYNEYSAQYNKVYTRQQIRTAGKNGIPFRDEYIFVQMAKKATSLAQSIKNGIGNEKISFLLSGRMSTSTGTRDIKLSDDFDTFTADSYTVSRWQTQLTKEGKKQLEQIGQLSTTLNNLMVAKSSDTKNWLKDSFGAGDCLKDIVARLKSIPQTISTLAPQLATQVKDIVEQPYEQAKALDQKYTNNLANVPGLTSTALLEGFNNNLNSTADSIESLITTMDGKLMGVLKSLPSNPEIAVFITTFDSCKVELNADKDKILNIVHRLSSLFGHSKKAADSAGDLGDQIKRLSYDAIPTDSQFDLKGTGQRANGDQIRIRAILEEPAKAGAQPLRKTIEIKSFKVQQIGLYSRVRPLLLLANPIGDGPNIDLAGKKFQFAPSYSILFKFGSRTSKAINEIWQPSFGVNFGALDFNTDAVPEFSTALEFTFLRDYFSVGYGYNFGADAKYFMVGFRIPVGALPLPMFNDIQSTGSL